MGGRSNEDDDAHQEERCGGPEEIVGKSDRHRGGQARLRNEGDCGGLKNGRGD